MKDITYQNVDQLLVAAVPELSVVRAKALATEGTEHPGQYVLFMDLDGAINEIIDSQDPETAPKLFGFFEQMAQSSDVEVVNLLWLAVLEDLLTNPNRLNNAWHLMGPSTKKLLRKWARKQKLDAVLPQ